MLFRDFVELLFRAYLEDHAVLERLRKKLKTTDHTVSAQGLDNSSDWRQALPADLRHSLDAKSRYYPSTLNPQNGVRVYEECDLTVSSKFKKLVKLKVFGND